MLFGLLDHLGHSLPRTSPNRTNPKHSSNGSPAGSCAAAFSNLLVAVPSHVIVRRRDDCCAPAGTFWGIATGISIMLLCFGPGVFFLFVERFQRLKPKDASPDKSAN